MTAKPRPTPVTAPRVHARACIETAIVDRAHELGFDLVGIAATDPPPQADHARFSEFVAAGKHGTMGYLARGSGARARLDHAPILAGARSVICVARSYHRPAEEVDADSGMASLIARHARGRDYHDLFRASLRALGRAIAELAPGALTRGLCDTAPVLERAWAARAGVGFVGKSNMLVSPTHGSELLLGEIVTDMPLTVSTPVELGCGACTRCLDECPTGALGAPWQIDARRCVAYLTIEHRGPAAEELERAAGSSLYGCDRCQLGCPYNGPSCAAAGDASPFRSLPVWSELRLPDLVDQTGDQWRARARGSPLGRLDREQIARNALWVAARWLDGDVAAGAEQRADALAALEEGTRAKSPATAELAARLRRRAGV